MVKNIYFSGLQMFYMRYAVPMLIAAPVTHVRNNYKK